MYSKRRKAAKPTGAMWLELLLGLTLIALLVQAIPIAIRMIDVWSWSQRSFVYMNVVIIAVLICIRVGPDLLEDWRKKRELAQDEKKNKLKAIALRQQRESAERARQSRKRRVY